MSPSILAWCRGGFLALLAALALVTALGTGLFETAHSSSATHEIGSHSHTAQTGRAKAHAAFQDEMRKLWEDHVTWTRLAIVTFADGSAGFDATAARLLRNQEDIGDAITPFFGEAAGEELTALLKDHIGIAVELLQAAKAGDDAAFEAAHAAWYANADDIAHFLAEANPRYWPQETLRAAMKGHLDQTLAEASHEPRRRLCPERCRLRRDPPPHPGHGRCPQRRHHPRLPQPLPLTRHGHEVGLPGIR